jgi:hypothetical protein
LPDLLNPSIDTIPFWQEIAYGEADHDLLGPTYRDVSLNPSTNINEANAALVNRFANGGVNTSFIPSPPFYSGRTCHFEFYSPGWQWIGSGARQGVFVLWDEDLNTPLGQLGKTTLASTSTVDNAVIYLATQFTPSRGNHMYTVRAWIFNGTGGTSFLIRNGGGGSGVDLPCWCRVTQLNS